MNHPFQITLGRPEDAQRLAEIKRVIWLSTYLNEELGITPADVEAKDFLCPERVAARAGHMQAGDGVNHTLVARRGEDILGYGRAVRGTNGTANEIVTLYVLPEWQRQGVGSKLLIDLIAWLGANEPITLEVVPFNSKAISVYEKHGFELRGEVRHERPVFPSGKDLPLKMMLRPGRG